MKKYMHIVSLILFIFTIGACTLSVADSKTVFMGTLQFPKAITTLPMVRVYFSGNKIKSETNSAGKRITFALPDDRRRTTFALIIAESIQFVSEYNTIKYLKIKSDHPYKFYILELVKLEQAEETEGGSKQKEALYEWFVTEQRIPYHDGRIPDDSIIVCFKPEYIDHLEGGNMVELPKIIIKDDILALAGSQDCLEDISVKLLLSSLDTDAIHSDLGEIVCHDFQRTKIKLIT